MTAQDEQDGDAVRLLAGGNPQIPKGEGDEPVQAYIAAMPGWKHDVGRRLDRLIEEAVPDVHKAVKWNTPLYGLYGRGWFTSYHCFAKYVKIAFHCQHDLDPLPPVDAKDPNTRYLHVHDGEELDEDQLRSWFEQAATAPGWEQ